MELMGDIALTTSNRNVHFNICPDNNAGKILTMFEYFDCIRHTDEDDNCNTRWIRALNTQSSI